MTGLPQAVVALTVGNRLVMKLQALRRRDGRRRRRLALPGEDVEHDVARDARGAHDGAAGAALERLGTGRLDRLQPILQHRREHLDELPVAVVVAREPGPQTAERVGQLPVLEGRAVPQRPGLPRQDRHVMPRIVDEPAAPEAPGVLGDDLAVLADDDPLGIGPYVHRPADGAGRDAVLVVVEAHQTGLGNRYLSGMEAVEGAAVRHQEGPLLLEHLPHRLAHLRF